MASPTRKPSPTDLSEKEWTLLEPLVPAVKDGGRPARWERREIANAICSVVRSGCTWRHGDSCPTICRPGRQSIPPCAPGAARGRWKLCTHDCGNASGARWDAPRPRVPPSSRVNR
jgi:transposase